MGFDSRLRKKEDILNDLEKEASFFRGNYYNQQSYFIYEPRYFNFKRNGNSINVWKSSGIDNYSINTDLNSVINSSSTKPQYINTNGRISVGFKENYMKQARIPFSHKSVVNIYIIYELNTISSTRNTDFTAQDCLFGAVKITKDTNTSHYHYSGSGICFDEGSNFSFGNIVNGKNVIIFGADMSFSSHTTNKVNNTYVLG